MTSSQSTILRGLYDIWAQTPDRWVTLKNRYHSPAAILAKSGLIEKRDNSPYRPTYQITEKGRQIWETQQPAEANESRDYWKR